MKNTDTSTSSTKYVHPLPRASLLDIDLPFEMLGLRSDLSGLPEEDTDSPTAIKTPTIVNTK